MDGNVLVHSGGRAVVLPLVELRRRNGRRGQGKEGDRLVLHLDGGAKSN